VECSGGDVTDVPSFFVENMRINEAFTVDMKCRIIPKIDNVPILDTLEWDTKVNGFISADAKPAIFLKTPGNAITVDAGADIFPLEFSWTKVAEADGYILKLASNGDFPESETISIPLGDVGNYELDAATAEQWFENFPQGIFQLYWTVEGVSSATVTQQIRQFQAIRKAPMKPDPRFANDLLLDAVFLSNGAALDISSYCRKVEKMTDPTMSVVWNEDYNRYVARFNPITPGSNKSGTDHTGCYKFDFSNDMAFMNSVNDGFSMETFIYHPIPANNTQAPFGCAESAGLTIQCRSNGYVYASVHTGSWVEHPGTRYPTDRFFHVLEIWDKTKSLSTLYIDGVKVSELASGTSLRLPAANRWIGIGADQGPAAQYLFKGDVAIARIYDSPLTPEDATYLYEQVKRW
jgi:hypothetical protein